MKNFFKISPLKIALIVIFIGIVSYWSGPSFLELMELKTIDFRFRHRKPIEPGPEVILAVIDEKSLAKEGKWVWPRTKFADLINRLSEAGAAVVSFDIGFLEETEKEKTVEITVGKIKDEIKTLGIESKKVETLLNQFTVQSQEDKALADAIANSKSEIVLGYFFHMHPEHGEHLTEQDIQKHRENILRSRYNHIRALTEDALDAKINTIEAFAPQANIEMIASAADYAGYFNMDPDEDGVVRWIPGVIKFQNQNYAPLSIMTVSAYLKTEPAIYQSIYGVEGFEIGDLIVPVRDIRGEIMINYRGGSNTFEHKSITDILHGHVPDEQLRDKIVIVGATATGIYDMRVTPYDPVFPGLEVHANVVDSILRMDYIFKPEWINLVNLLAIIFSGLLLGLVLPRVDVVPGTLTGIILFFGYIFVCYYLFSSYGLIVNMVYPSLVIVTVYVSITAYRFLLESQQKKFIRNAFSTYLSPTVVDNLIRSGRQLQLGGEERTITAFFSDVQNFTSISEMLEPTVLVELLNEFLTEMADILMENGGTLDKFEGDAIIAFFGAPYELENQALSACITAIAMQQRLAELREKWKQQHLPLLNMRIGMNKGPAVVGNMGSKKRMDYTMMGDTVNLAARLEGVNKLYGTYTLVSENTFRDAGESITAREIDSIIVVGRQEAIKVFEIVGYTAEMNDAVKYTIEHYEAALGAYRKRDWDRAIELFERAMEFTPQDRPSQALISRCREYKKNPPPDSWNGAFVMTTK